MRIKFDSSFARHDNTRRVRHGALWTEQDYDLLNTLFKEGADLEIMCEKLQRPADGVLNKLTARRLLTYDALTGNYYYYSAAVNGSIAEFKHNHIKFTIPEKETPTMNANTIESKTFINGADATNMSDTEIFRLIAKTEGEIAKLKDIKTQSKKLTAAIAAMEADVVKLAEYVDSRE